MKPRGGGTLWGREERGREGGGKEEVQKLKSTDAQTRAAWSAPPAGGRFSPDSTFTGAASSLHKLSLSPSV